MLRSELWKSSHYFLYQITVLSALVLDKRTLSSLTTLHTAVRFIWAHLLKPKITVWIVLTVEEALSDSHSCFMLPQIKKKKICCRKIRWPWMWAHVLTELVSGSCVFWTKRDYDLLLYLSEMRKRTQYGFF